MIEDPLQVKKLILTKEELFDSNLAIFDEGGDLTGGLLYAAKKTGGLKLDANEIGNMIKLNPVNRLKPQSLVLPKKGAKFKKVRTNADEIKKIKTLFSKI